MLSFEPEQKPRFTPEQHAAAIAERQGSTPRALKEALEKKAKADHRAHMVKVRAADSADRAAAKKAQPPSRRKNKKKTAASESDSEEEEPPCALDDDSEEEEEKEEIDFVNQVDEDEREIFDLDEEGAIDTHEMAMEEE
jgi:hypothetical protein